MTTNSEKLEHMRIRKKKKKKIIKENAITHMKIRG